MKPASEEAQAEGAGVPEGADDLLIAKLNEVSRAVAEKPDDHVASDTHFMGVLGAEEASQAAGQTEV